MAFAQFNDTVRYAIQNTIPSLFDPNLEFFGQGEPKVTLYRRAVLGFRAVVRFFQ